MHEQTPLAVATRAEPGLGDLTALSKLLKSYALTCHSDDHTS